ncbi:hypothetical protein PR048_014840 [Dryococelus australis]|uniref:DUF4371 domain-containing protein n=1 Tax=Dryococelus australis TaxID=614101 RepID=A0ABQ9HFB1_9NEOP|nr:hypothetical protein PR048_014840 [Dryococelus australis]
MDITMDVSSNDQCVIVLRYLLGTEVQEIVVGLKCVQSTTGESLFEMLLDILNDVGIVPENYRTNPSDGASNMSSEYSSASARLKTSIHNHIHTWYYSRVLNLVMPDTTQCLPASVSFLGLLQQTRVFLKGSHKRFHVYLKQNPRVLLSAIGVTRWRSRSDATTNIFGRFHYWVGTEDTDNTSHQETVFVELVVTPYTIGNSQHFNPKVRNEANALLQKFLSLETILVAVACRPVSTAQNELEARSQFDQVFRAAEMFASVLSRLLDEKIEGNPSLEAENLYLELALPSKRVRKIKKIPGELADDEETAVSEEDKFRINDWPQISSSLTEEYTRDADMESDSESETSEEIVQNERAFSKLKLIKTRNRSNMTNGNLESFLIMQCERDKLVALDNVMVIDKLCEQSEEMRRLLVL